MTGGDSCHATSLAAADVFAPVSYRLKRGRFWFKHDGNRSNEGRVADTRTSSDNVTSMASNRVLYKKMLQTSVVDGNDGIGALYVTPPDQQSKGADSARDQPLHQLVYVALRRGLMSGQYCPGQTVSLRNIATALGTSLMPVRAAVSRLIAERALQLLPNRTIVVPALTRRSFKELTAVRKLLEGMAAEQAARLRSPDLVAQLTQINAELKKAIANRQEAQALLRNREFHFCLYEASRSEVLLPLIESLWLQVGPFMHVSMAMPEARWKAAHHQGAINGLRRSDAAEVRRAIERDIAESADELLARGVFAD